jgi:Leucine-rich repeat (LRR) protein
MRQLLILLLVILSGLALGQSAIQKPIFKMSSDSAKYHRWNNQLRLAFQNKETELANALIDSLAVLRTTKIIGYRLVYEPRFPTLDSALRMAPDRVLKLSLSGNHVKDLPRELYTFKNLQTLELIDTAVPRIPGKLRNLPQLKTLYVLNHAGKKRLRLGKNETIRQLNIRAKDVRKIPRSFRALSRLEKLDLSSSCLVDFPKRIHQNKKLKSLILNDNQLTLAEPLKGHPGLEQLELRNNKIKTVSADIGRFPMLKRLIFTNNEISSVALEISQLQQLKEVAFYNNKLKTIPAGLYSISSLREVDLYYNEIERLDPLITRWENMEVLYLSNNRLIALPEALGQLTSLKELYLSNNRLSALPNSLMKLENLKVLRVNQNYLNDIPEAAYTLALENLDVSRNKITTVDHQLFTRKQLKILSLVGNEWDMMVRDLLPVWAEELRKNGTIVHLNTFEESIDGN